MIISGARLNSVDSQLRTWIKIGKSKASNQVRNTYIVGRVGIYFCCTCSTPLGTLKDDDKETRRTEEVHHKQSRRKVAVLGMI